MKAPTPSAWLMSQKKTASHWIRPSILLGVLAAVLLIVQLHWVARIITDVFLHGAGQATILPGLCAILSLILIRAVLAWLKEICGFKAGAKIRHNLRMHILAQIETLGPILSKQKRSGEWVSSALEQVEALQGFFAQYLPQMSLCVMIPLMIVATVFTLNWPAAVLLFITAPLIPLFMALVGMGANGINQKNFQALSRMSAHFLDVLQGLNTLKLFDRSRAETAKIYAVSENYRKTTMQTLRIAFLSSGVLEFFAACSVALLATYLGLSLLHDLHFGQPVDLYRALFILLLAPEFFLPLRELSTHYHARAAAIGAAEELMEIINLSPPSLPNPDQSITKQGDILIDCQDLGFTYPHSKPSASLISAPVLKNFSLQIKAGEHIGLIGESGCGKSTFLHLILGFLHPSEGQLHCTAPLNQIGWLAQQPTLFHGTIRSNLLMAQPTATDAELWQALEQAFMRETVQNFPAGIDTVVGEQNQGLSGGQAQRIALARLYLKKPQIFLLDEPTTGLDQESAQAVLQSLNQQTQGKTVILATHRPEPLLSMDRVVQL